MERIDLTNAEVIPEVRTTSYAPVSVLLDWGHARIVVELDGTHGERKAIEYLDAEAQLRALNTANLSTQSLHRRLLARLIADGHLVGTVSGTPDA